MQYFATAMRLVNQNSIKQDGTMKKNNIINLSLHAKKRSQQRGVRKWIIPFIVENADKYKHCGKNCISQFISEKKIEVLIRNGVLKAAEGSLLKGVVVVSEDETIITVFHKQIRMRA